MNEQTTKFKPVRFEMILGQDIGQKIYAEYEHEYDLYDIAEEAFGVKTTTGVIINEHIRTISGNKRIDGTIYPFVIAIYF